MSSAAVEEMQAVQRRLAAIWERTRDEWRDATAQDFAQETMAPLETASKQTLQAMQALADAMSKARSRIK